MRPTTPMRRTDRTLTLLTATLALAVFGGCWPDDPGGGSPGELESGAGITLSPEPSLRLEGARPGGDAEAFGMVRWATHLPQGGIVIADQYASRLHFHDAAGAHVRSVGREGEGPGEFGSIMWIDRCGTDSLFVRDGQRQAFIVLDSVGSFVREFRSEVSAYEVRCSRRGWLAAIGFPREYIGPGADGRRALAPVWIMDREGRTLAAFDDVPIGENRPLGRNTRIAPADDRLYLGTADSAWVEVLGLDGSRSPTLPVGGREEAPLQADFDAALEQMLSVTPVEELREMLRARYIDLPLPERLPAYRELAVDPRGLVWAVTSAPGRSPTVIRVVDGSGTFIGRVDVPGALNLFEVGEDHLLGQRTDGPDGDAVVVHDIAVSGGG